MIRKLLAVGAGLTVAMVGSTALAQDAAHTPGASAGLLAGYGFKSIDVGGGESINPYGLGIGARVGYTLPAALYIGGAFLYHLGGSKDANAGPYTISAKYNIIFVGAEVGYELPVGPVIIRPSAMVGVGMFHSSLSTSPSSPFAPDQSDTQSKLWIAPGATVIYPMGNLFIGGDVRYHIISGVDNANAPAVYFTFGLNF